jgi:hypothetical protein
MPPDRQLTLAAELILQYRLCVHRLRREDDEKSVNQRPLLLALLYFVAALAEAPASAL